MVENADFVDMKTSPDRGRLLVATSDIPKDTVIIHEPPFASVSKSPLFCSGCFEKMVIPAYCRPFLCEACISKYNNKCYAVDPYSRMDMDTKSLVILCFKIAVRIIDCDTPIDDFLARICYANENIVLSYWSGAYAIAALCKSDLKVNEEDIEFVTSLLIKCYEGLELDVTRYVRPLVKHIFSIFQFNLQGIRCLTETPDGMFSEERIGSGIYTTLALLNHTCKPNTRIYFVGSDIVVVANRDISKGEEITHNYGPNVLHMDRARRQEVLKFQYNFTCDCLSCSKKEVEYSFKCSLCSGLVWMEDIKCDSCGQLLDHDRYNSLNHEVLRNFYRLDDCLNVSQNTMKPTEVDYLVKCAKSLYFDKNILFGNIMDSCAQYYDKVNDLEKAINCANVCSDIVKEISGSDSQSYGIELVKLCKIKIKQQSLKNIEQSSELLDQVKCCVKIVSRCKTYNMTSLQHLEKWIEACGR